MSQRPDDLAGRSSCSTLGLSPSFGFGDRIGLATPGHVAAMNRSGAGIEPIFPQQSIREMARTGRAPGQVMSDALAGMASAGWSGRTGADADHLKTPEDVDVTAAVGFTFFTIDPSEHVDAHADDYDEPTLRARFSSLGDDVSWLPAYLGKSVTLSTGTTVVLDEPACLRAAVKYGRALNHAIALAGHIRRVNEQAARDYEIELSVDETEQPTTLAEHYIIADQCLLRGMRLVSLAPRYIGDFEKGVDYKGDVAGNRTLASAITPRPSPRCSARTSSAFTRVLTSSRCTLPSPARRAASSTSRPPARATLKPFASSRATIRLSSRQIVSFARDHYDTDKATYHVSATLKSAPAADLVASDTELESLYLEHWADVPRGLGFTKPGRQILHCTFGSVLTDRTLGTAIRQVIESHQETYTEVLLDHFSRHLDALGEGI